MAKRTGLTNLELAGNPTWVIASTFVECDACSFLCRDTELTRLNEACPECGHSGTRRLIWPDISCIRWLKMIGDSYVSAYARRGAKQAELAEEIKADLKKNVDAEWVAVAIRKVRRLSRKYPMSSADYDTFLKSLQNRLSLSSREEGRLIYPYLARFDEPSNEYGNLVVSTDALYKKLLTQFLIRLLVSGGISPSDAHKRISNEWHFKELVRVFEKQTHTTLRKAVMRYGVRGLYELWRSISTLRNRHLHRSPFSINSEVAEKAFNLAKHGFSLFAFLHNSYCLSGGHP